jgi:hypothetical protein
MHETYKKWIVWGYTPKDKTLQIISYSQYIIQTTTSLFPKHVPPSTEIVMY